jgi:FkbM family methyltransferase
MVRQEVLDTVGGYDEHNFFVNWEDIDWCRRIFEAGYAVHYVAAARGIHHLGVSTATNTAMVSMTGRAGAIRYFRKHQGRVVALMLRVALLPGDLMSLATLSIRSVFSSQRRRRGRLAASILAVTWLNRRPWVPASRRPRGVKKAGRSAFQRLLRIPGMAAVGEWATRFLGRRWPDSEVAIAPRFQIIDHLLVAGKPTERISRLPGGACLAVDVADYAGRRLYFCLSRKINRGWLYEPETTRFIWNWLRPGDTFIDAGANAGYFSAMAASLVGPRGQVHAFEPNPRVSRLLERSVELNRFHERLRVNQLALTDRAGSVQLWCRPDGKATDDATTLRHADRIPVQVESTTLDAYCQASGIGTIRLIKIDVEGAELEVLRGASHVLSAIRPDAIVIEFAPVLLTDSDRTWAKLIAAFSTHGYSVNGLDIAGSPTPRGEDAPIWQWGNVCFLSESSLSPLMTLPPAKKGREPGK